MALPSVVQIPFRFWSSLAGLVVFSLSLSAGPLEDYVGAPDPTFNWKRCEQKKISHATLTHLELVSQTWHGQFWSHHMLVVRPEKVTHPEIALLFVTGGGYGAPDDKEADRFNLIAQRAGAIAAVITKIPNQPLYDGRTEDALIAYTFDQYLKSGDKTWPLLFPMVKSAVRGMDTLQQFAGKEWNQEVKQFVISGASKRGWTTWLTGATDPRVKAIAPMVIDMLNMKTQLAWASKMYGKQSEEINDYTTLHLDTRDDEPMRELRSWVDPYVYRNRYTMPKLLLLGTNDPYWVVDSLRNYWKDLPGAKVVFQTPNAGHDLGGGKDAVTTLANWFALVAADEPLPDVTWNLHDGASGPAGIDVSVNQPAKAIRLWTAHSTDRDFRNDKWSSRDLDLAGDQKSAHADVEKPAEGFTAFMAEVELPTSHGDTYKLSTQVQVVPDLVNHNP
jgi:PhoPQ-activated pathogenicity-related protein